MRLYWFTILSLICFTTYGGCWCQAEATYDEIFDVPSTTTTTTTTTNNKRNKKPIIYIPTNFVGLSVEYSWIKELIAGNNRMYYAQLLQKLVVSVTQQQQLQQLQHTTTSRTSTATRRRPLIIRIGGNSADRSCYVEPKTKQQQRSLPKGCKHRVVDQDIIDLANYTNYVRDSYNMNVSYVIDTNFGLSSTPDVVATSHIKRIDELNLWWKYISAIEIGNEINLYARHGIYRNTSYDYDTYEEEFGRYADAYIKNGMPPHHFIQGGTFTSGGYTRQLNRYLTKFKDKDNLLKTISYHIYPLTWNSSQENINSTDTIEFYQSQLLGRKGVQGAVRRLSSLIKTALDHNIPFVLGETNSVCRGGMPGVSDSFASALWVIDYLTALSKAGVQQVLLHGGPSPSSTYTAFAYDPKSHQLQVRPLYYGILLFNELIGSVEGSRWIKTYVLTPIDKQTAAAADPLCKNGILAGDDVCCSLSCGVCGGPSCAQRPGGPKKCCGSQIHSSGISCDNSTAPCIVNQTRPDDAIVFHSTYNPHSRSVRTVLLAKRSTFDDRTITTAAATTTVNICLPRALCSDEQPPPLAACRTARIIRLTAPSIHSTFSDEILLGGQTFRNTTSGKPVGNRREEVVSSKTIDDGFKCFPVEVEPLSAVLLKVDNVNGQPEGSVAIL